MKKAADIAVNGPLSDADEGLIAPDRANDALRHRSKLHHFPARSSHSAPLRRGRFVQRLPVPPFFFQVVNTAHAALISAVAVSKSVAGLEGNLGAFGNVPKRIGQA